MKHIHVKSHVGVWLDHSNAVLYAYNPEKADDGFTVVEKLDSPEAGGRSENDAKKSNRHRYYNDLAKRLGGYDEILLFGPGTAQEELRNELMLDKHFQSKRIDVRSENSLTEHQRNAFVRNHFASVLQ